MPSQEQSQNTHNTQDAGHRPPHLPKVMVGYDGEDPPYISRPVKADIAGVQSACMISVQSVSETREGVETFAGVVVGVTARKIDDRSAVLKAVYQELETRGFACAQGHPRVEVTNWPGPHFFVRGSEQYPSGVLKDMIVHAVKAIEQSGVAIAERPERTEELQDVETPVAPKPQPKVETVNMADYEFNNNPTASVKELSQRMSSMVRQELQEQPLSSTQCFQLMNHLMTDVSVIFQMTTPRAPAAAPGDEQFDLDMEAEAVTDPLVENARRKTTFALSSEILKHELSFDEQLILVRSFMKELTSIFAHKEAA